MSQTAPTMRLIAERCQVSRSTVSLALRGDPRISPRVTALVTSIALELGYVTDPRVASVMRHIATKTNGRKSSLGVLFGSNFTRRDPWADFPGLSQLYQEVAARAGALGYGLDPFWLGERGMTPRRMKEIMMARGIEGLIVFEHPQSSMRLEFDFSPFTSAAVGYGWTPSGLDSVASNLHNDFSKAWSELAHRAYLRPGLAFDGSCSEYSLLCWKSAYCYQESLWGQFDRIPICHYTRANLRELADWYYQYQPDVILGLPWSTYHDLQALGIAIPEESAFVALQQDGTTLGLTGIDLQYRALATKAVDLVAEKLGRFEKGIPAEAQLVLYDGVWLDGKTLPDKGPFGEPKHLTTAVLGRSPEATVPGAV